MTTLSFLQDNLSPIGSFRSSLGALTLGNGIHPFCCWSFSFSFYFFQYHVTKSLGSFEPDQLYLSENIVLIFFDDTSVGFLGYPRYSQESCPTPTFKSISSLSILLLQSNFQSKNCSQHYPDLFKYRHIPASEYLFHGFLYQVQLIS